MGFRIWSWNYSSSSLGSKLPISGQRKVWSLSSLSTCVLAALFAFCIIFTHDLCRPRGYLSQTQKYTGVDRRSEVYVTTSLQMEKIFWKLKTKDTILWRKYYMRVGRTIILTQVFLRSGLACGSHHRLCPETGAIPISEIIESSSNQELYTIYQIVYRASQVLASLAGCPLAYVRNRLWYEPVSTCLKISILIYTKL